MRFLVLIGLGAVLAGDVLAQNVRKAQRFFPAGRVTNISDALAQNLPTKSGLVIDAADATRRAVAWANRVLRSYPVRPIKENKATAVFDGTWWQWRARVGYQKSDLEITVYMLPDGTSLHHELIHLVSRL